MQRAHHVSDHASRADLGHRRRRERWVQRAGGSARRRAAGTSGVPSCRAAAIIAPAEHAVALDFTQSATLAPALHAVTDLLLIGAMGPAQTEQELALVAAAASAGVRRVVNSRSGAPTRS